MKPSPLAPKEFALLPAIDGLQMAVCSSAVKYKNRDDLLLMQFDEGTSLSGVFTQSATASAPVLASRDVVKKGAVRAILVNAGNANAFTGASGNETVTSCVTQLAKAIGVPADEICTASTGVIGEPLAPHLITDHFETLKSVLGKADWQDAAKAICTTDTFAKGASRSLKLAGQDIHISGIAKGSGMIAPDMATMLAFIATNASIPAQDLQSYLSEFVTKSFNAITVDSDTSTSDSVYLAATNKGAHLETEDDIKAFKNALFEVMRDLAILIVKDGEGATKLITIDVTGAKTDISAHKIAMAIGNSPLVKTAIAGEDANWGRIVMAVGKAGEPADRDLLAISIGGYQITANGQRRDDYDETPLAAYMKGQEIHIEVDIGLGQGSARIWSCDLTHGYISINADYRS